MKKKAVKVFLVILILVISLIGIIYWKFFTLQGVSEGEPISEFQSPNGDFLVKTYFKYGGSLSADAVRAELVNSKTNRKKNIYWNYPDVNPYVEWIDNDTVRIGEQSLNIAKGETYDWRKDDEWKRDLPKQRSEDDPYEKMREDPESFSY